MEDQIGLSDDGLRGPINDFFSGEISLTAVGPISAETTEQVGLSGIYALADHLSLDFGLYFGEGTLRGSVRAAEINEAGSVSADVEILGGHLMMRFYPFSTRRIRPWMSAGLRGAVLRTDDAVLTIGSLEASLRNSLKSTGTGEFAYGLGVDLAATPGFEIAVLGDYAGDLGWRAALALQFTVGSSKGRSSCRGLLRELLSKEARVPRLRELAEDLRTIEALAVRVGGPASLEEEATEKERQAAQLPEHEQRRKELLQHESAELRRIARDMEEEGIVNDDPSTEANETVQSAEIVRASAERLENIVGAIGERTVELRTEIKTRCRDSLPPLP